MFAALRSSSSRLPSLAGSSTRTAAPRLIAFLSNDASTTPSSSKVTAGDFLEPIAEFQVPKPDVPPIPDRGYPHPSGPTQFSYTMLNMKAQKPKYKLHCHSTRNNTIVTVAKPDGGCLAWFSGGSCKFKKANRATYEAGYQCAVKAFRVIEGVAKDTPIQLELYFKGFGEGREAMKTAMLAVEGQSIRPLVCQITDRTPIKIGGTRAKKTRRL